MTSSHSKFSTHRSVHMYLTQDDVISRYATHSVTMDTGIKVMQNVTHTTTINYLLDDGTFYNDYWSVSIATHHPATVSMLTDILLPKIVLLSILAVLLVLFNGLLIFTILFHKHLRTKANYFVVALACSDFSMGCPSIPLHCLGEAGVLGTTQDGCLLVMCFSCAQIVLSVLMLFALSLERYFKLVHPFSYAKHITKHKVLASIIVCSLYSFIIGFLPLMGWNNIAVATENATLASPCRFEIVLSGTYIALVFLGRIGPTFVVLPLLHLHIFITAHKVLRRRKPLPLATSNTNLQHCTSRSLVDFVKNLHNSSNSSLATNSPSTPLKSLWQPPQHKNQVVAYGYHPKTSRNYRHFKILVLMGGYFIVSWIPLVIWETVLFEGFTKRQVTVQDLVHSNTPMFYYIALGLAILNSTVNPILFGMGNSTTRRAFINTMLKCKKTTCPHNDENSINSLVVFRDHVVYNKPKAAMKKYKHFNVM